MTDHSSISWDSVGSFFELGRPFPPANVVELFAAAAPLVDKEARRLEVYEPGCGTGRLLIPLARHFPKWKFTGLDCSREMLDVFRARCAGERLKNVEIVEGELNAFQVSDRFDLMIISSLLHALQGWKEAFGDLLRSIKPAGMVALVGEDSDLYSAVLGRARCELLSDSVCDPALQEFWDKYLAERKGIGLPDAESSQVGCRWDFYNTEPAELLAERGFKEIGSNTVRWVQPFSVKDHLEIVRRRCYSSMFTTDPKKYQMIVDDLEIGFGARLEEPANSNQVALVRIFSRSSG